MSAVSVKRAGKASPSVVAVKPDDGRELLTVPEAAYLLHLSPRATWNRVWSKDPAKRLETVWIGSRRFVPRQAITAYVRNLCAVHHAEATYDLIAG